MIWNVPCLKICLKTKPQILVVKAPTKSKTHTSDIMSSSELTFSIRPFEELSLVELYEIMRLRQEVFVVEQNCPYLDADGKDLDSLHVLGFENKKLCCYCRLLPKGISYPDATSIGRVITSQEVRGKGYGKKMMEAAISTLKMQYPDHPIKISAQKYLKLYYESFGFVDSNIEYLEDNIWHILMVKQ